MFDIFFGFWKPLFFVTMFGILVVSVTIDRIGLGSAPAYITSEDSGFQKDAEKAAAMMNFDGAGAINYEDTTPEAAIAKEAGPPCTAIAGNLDSAHIMTPEMISYYPGGFDHLGINPPPPGSKLLTTRLPLNRAAFAVVPCDQVARRLYVPVYVHYETVKDWTFTDHSELHVDANDPETYTELLADIIPNDPNKDHEHNGKFMLACSKLDYSPLPKPDITTARR